MDENTGASLCPTGSSAVANGEDVPCGTIAGTEIDGCDDATCCEEGECACIFPVIVFVALATKVYYCRDAMGTFRESTARGWIQASFACFASLIGCSSMFLEDCSDSPCRGADGTAVAQSLACSLAVSILLKLISSAWLIVSTADIIRAVSRDLQ